MQLNELVDKSYKLALKKGWWDTDRPIREAILMTIVELAEAVQKDRCDDNEGFNEEIADVFIRLFDICGYLDIDIESEIERKLRINEKREYRHGKKY